MRVARHPLHLWIGRFEVRPRVGSSGPDWWTDPPEIAGAFVNVLALAKDASAFRERVASALSDDDLDVISAEDVEVFDRRVMTHDLNPDLIELAREARFSREVVFSTFDTYPPEDQIT
jgi:hypothetical protein